jgi:hypothetical protein
LSARRESPEPAAKVAWIVTDWAVVIGVGGVALMVVTGLATFKRISETVLLS